MDNLHYVQMTILKQLLFKQKVSFGELIIPGVDSETLSYHLRSLIKHSYIEKDNNGLYSLTLEGKKYAAEIDVETSLISSRAKLSILVTAIDESEGDPKYLLIKRLKEPLFGQACFIAGKVKYGEPSASTAKRELFEESGLTANEVEFVCFHRQFVYNQDNEFLKDNSFCMFVVKNFSGEIKSTEEAEPFWVNKDEFYKLTNKAYDLEDLFEIMTNPPKEKFIEKDFIAKVF